MSKPNKSTIQTSEYLHSPEKRAFDIAIASSLGALALIGGAATAAALAALNRTKPVFRQERQGAGGEPVSVIKLKTMDSRGNLLTLGEIARDSGLDETPQFLNVLLGQMSVVSYRPLLGEDLDHATQRLRAHYPDDSPWSATRWMSLREESKPGITGPAQTMPFRPDAGSVEHLAAVVKQESDYLETATLSTDLGLVGKTPAALLQGHNPSVQRATGTS